MSIDNKEYGVISDCCGAEIKFGDICCGCGEHCDPVDENEETEEE